jgi:hypothetical protein
MYRNLTIEHIDQLVYRFQKLTDDMGTKLFKSIDQTVKKEGILLY